MRKNTTLVLVAFLALLAITAGTTRKNKYNITYPVLSIVADSMCVDTDGTAADLNGYKGCLIIGSVGATHATVAHDIYLELEVEESTDNSSFTDVADADLIGFVAGTNDGTFAVVDSTVDDAAIFTCSYIGAKRYVRVVASFTGTQDGWWPVSATIVRTDPKYSPAR